MRRRREPPPPKIAALQSGVGLGVSLDKLVFRPDYKVATIIQGDDERKFGVIDIERSLKPSPPGVLH